MERRRIVVRVAASALCVALAFAVGMAAGASEVESPDRGHALSSLRVARQPARVATSVTDWHGGPVVASDGHSVTVLVSDAYGGPPNTPELWAEAISGLVHESEITSVVVHVMPIEELQEVCGEDAIGCYGFGRMYVPGDPVYGVAPMMVATHEYGHHIAAHRNNPPWAALDWGTKRWATYEEICPRAEAREVYPGDEASGYALNPGEGFVEAYRALNEVRHGATSFTWTLIDPSLYPDESALLRVEQDVLDPWTAPTTSTVRARFTESGKRTWWRVIDLPLDGTLEISASMPLASGYVATLRTVDGSTILRRARWISGAPSRTISYVVCGARAVRLQLYRTGGPGLVTMRLSIP